MFLLRRLQQISLHQLLKLLREKSNRTIGGCRNTSATFWSQAKWSSLMVLNLWEPQATLSKALSTILLRRLSISTNLLNLMLTHNNAGITQRRHPPKRLLVNVSREAQYLCLIMKFALSGLTKLQPKRQNKLSI